MKKHKEFPILIVNKYFPVVTFKRVNANTATRNKIIILFIEEKAQFPV